MGNKRQLVILIVILAIAYGALGLLVSLRIVLHPDPDRAAEAYLRAIMDRDVNGIYMYSDLLGPHLAGLMAKSDLHEDIRRQMWAKDFVRWRSEFEKGSKANDSMKRERRLLHGQVQLERVDGADFKAEVQADGEWDLVSYQDDPGQTHHAYYRITYPAADGAPPVSILDNVRTGPERRIRSVIIRVQVSRRPDVGDLRSALMSWDWLDQVAVAFPHRILHDPADPSEAWMVGVSFAIDKKTLQTF